MSLAEIFTLLDKNPLVLIIISLSLPLLALITGLLHGRGNGGRSPWKYIYSVFIYISSVPGIFFLFIIFYLLVFQKINLLQLNLVTYLLPVISMTAVLLTIRKFTSFDEIPGFKKIIGLFVLLLSTFVILLILDRLRIFLFFRGSILTFMLIWIGIFAALKIAAGILFGKIHKK